MNYPTNLFEAIAYPVGDFVGEWLHRAAHPSVFAVICLGIVVKVALGRAWREGRAGR